MVLLQCILSEQQSLQQSTPTKIRAAENPQQLRTVDEQIQAHARDFAVI